MVDHSHLSRLGALRRPKRAALPAVRTPSLEMHPQTGAASYRHAPLHLSPTMFIILNTLAAHPGVRFSRAQLMELVAVDDAEGNGDNIDYHIRQIRLRLHRARPWSGFLEDGPLRFKHGWYWAELGDLPAPPPEAPEEPEESAPEPARLHPDLTPLECDVVEAARLGERPMHTAQRMKRPLPWVVATLTKARHLGLATYPET